MTKRIALLLLCVLLGPAAGTAAEVHEIEPLEAVERHLPADGFTRWSHDPELLRTESGDRLEQREVVADAVETVKLRNLVAPVRFASGVADIPPSYIARLRGVLDSMRHLENVRLHLVGHADAQPLSEALAGVYGDNAGLSRERAGEVAEFLQGALALPPESVSFEWAGDTRPIAPNDTVEGRAMNRRVEVEVWYDEIGEEVAVEDVVVAGEIKRIKVCRVETVCKLRYREGHALRARVRNLIAPLHYGDDSVGVPDSFVLQIQQALENLRHEPNVTVKFIGFTDDVPLVGREERIYGTHLALSKARAHRVALAVRDALDLSTSAIASDGHGASRPVASNETEQGRALNRRIEVEFWHDDPLQQLPEDPQPCPEDSHAEVVTKVYDPPWGRIPAIVVEDGEPSVPPGLADALRRATDDLAGETNVRLRFVGYTRNERLDRRTALVYGDDIGLSTARARRAMEAVGAELGLDVSTMEHEGRGYVHASDVVNAGFIQGDTSHVAVQVVYDQLAVLDDLEGVDVTPLTRELRPEDPLALNLMRITVDGKPLDDPGRSSADVQRCTDVAFDRADIRFQFDALESEPRLSVTAHPTSVPVRASEGGAGAAEPVLFRMYTNYPHFIERSEVRVFDLDQSTRDVPLDLVEIGTNDVAEWRPTTGRFAGPVRELMYVLRAYDGDGRFDETVPRPLWLFNGDPEVHDGSAEPPDELLAGYGEGEISSRSIELGSVGTVRVDGRGIPPRHSVFLAGEPVPVDEGGRFLAETILPSGMHTVEVAVLDEEGNGELFLRDVEFRESDWFYVGMADLTFSGDIGGGRPDLLTGEDAPYDPDSFADGRLAFFLNGKFGKDWKLTASADTREEPVEDLFSNFLDKSPESLFRRIDPEYYYPTFGDDGTVEESAPTSGKFFARLSQRENHALWGNFEVGYLDNELAHVDRGLYGANLHYQSLSATGFGEQRVVLDGFAAEPGTIGSREEFRGTGGSLYFLRRQDLLVGSERVRIEVRDKDSGLVSGVAHLQPGVDYDIDYLQGRILLSEPIGAIAEDDLLIRTGGLSGDEAWLVAQYEYTPGFDEIDALAAGGRGHVWLGDFLKLGLTTNRNDEDGTDSSLYAGDVTLRRSAGTWLKLQAGRSEGVVSSSLRSDDGGFDFLETPAVPTLTDADAHAYRADLSVGFEDVFEGRDGEIVLYGQMVDAGYSAPGMNTFTDTQQYGGRLGMALMDGLRLDAKADRLEQERGLETTAGELDLAYQLTSHWNLSTGVRHEIRDDESPLVAVTQEQGRRTDAVVQVGYDSLERWRSYTFAQTTVSASGDMEDNQRFGFGGAYRVSERLFFDGEVSHGDGGPATKVGSTFQQNDRTSYYLNYSLENERNDGLLGRGGSLVTGARSRFSDSASVYLENRYQHAGDTGLTQAVGLTLSPMDRWNLSVDWEHGTLTDRETHAETERRAGGVSIGYAFDSVRFSSGVEYRFDESEMPDGSESDRTTWLFRNDLKLQLNPDWRLLGSLNHAFSDSSLGDFFAGGYTKGILGWAYRPVEHDRLNALAKYTYFHDVPTVDQVSVLGSPSRFLQKSHVAALDLSYDLMGGVTLGGKYAYRLGQVSVDRDDPEFFDNSAHLYLVRGDWRFLKDWETSVEGRMLDLTDLSERRAGALLSIHRYLGDHFKVGVGYNFTDFSEDLTDLSYDHHGWFVNFVGTL